MSVLKRLDDLVMHPVTVVSVLIGSVASIVQVPFVSALVATVWNQAGTVFAMASLSANQGWLPPGTGQAAVLIAGGLFLGRMLDKLLDGIERRLDK